MEKSNFSYLYRANISLSLFLYKGNHLNKIRIVFLM